jgi:hypothetical protein
LIAKGRACLQEFASQMTVAVSEDLDQRHWESCDPQNPVRQSLGACSAASYARGTLTASNASAHSVARWISPECVSSADPRLRTVLHNYLPNTR